VNILISTDPPKHLRITQTLLEDLLWDPVMAAWVFFKIKLDAFQAVRLRIYWLTPDVEDHSGFTSGKTIVDWVWCNLSAVLLYDCHIGAIFQTFQIGKDNFWQYYKEFSTPLFRAQLGLMEEEVRDKSQFKEPGCWKQHFKNKSLVAMPAPGFLQEARNLAGWRVNRLLIDEWTKIMMSAGGAEGIQKQLLGRVTRPCYNANHPVWCNKVVRSATAELGNHPGFRVHREYEREEEKVWASKLLTLFGLQTLKVQAETDEQGIWKLTKNNARRFFSTDKDDFHDAGRNAYIAFRIWLLDCDAGWSVNERDAALCRSR